MLDGYREYYKYMRRSASEKMENKVDKNLVLSKKETFCFRIKNNGRI